MEEEGEGREVRELLRQARDIPHVLRHLLDAIRRHSGVVYQALRRVYEALRRMSSVTSLMPSDDIQALLA